jgi:tetratricopeptide (TPR) repeat protein
VKPTLPVVLTTFCTLSAAAATAQAPAEDPHAACASGAWVPAGLLERPVPRRTGTGNAHEVVTTSSPEAQAFYDQGLDYLHGYVWLEAGRSFHQALRHDPSLAMAWVGLSRVYSGVSDPSAAKAALARAQALAGPASAHEKRRIEVRATQLEAMDDLANPAKLQAYRAAIDAALAVQPDDVELWLIRAQAEEPTAAGRGQRGGIASTAYYHRALQLRPDLASAHHYLTHSYETIGQIPAALVHGEAYARLAPAIPHSHHMWGHDLRRVGRIDDAIAAFTRTDELEKAYYAAEGIDASLDWHHVHNLDLLATAYQHKGQMKAAERLLREADAMPPLTDYLEWNQKALAVFLLGRERWPEAQKAAEKLAAGRWGAAQVVGHTLIGHVHLAAGRVDAARGALAAAEKALLTIPVVVGGISPTRAALEPYVAMLRGEMALRTDRLDEGRVLLEDVARKLRAQLGPDAWINALFRLELIARVAREVGAWDLAENIARQMIEHDAAYGGGHYALALVARHRGDVAAADLSLAEAERRWSGADPDLVELTRTRELRSRAAR